MRSVDRQKQADVMGKRPRRDFGECWTDIIHVEDGNTSVMSISKPAGVRLGKAGSKGTLEA